MPRTEVSLIREEITFWLTLSIIGNIDKKGKSVFYSIKVFIFNFKTNKWKSDKIEFENPFPVRKFRILEDVKIFNSN